MQTTPSYRIFLVAGILSLFASYLGIWIRLINSPAERTGSDFIAFYSAGRIAQTEGVASVYKPLLQQKIQEEEVGFPLIEGQVLLYNHLPFLIPILQIIVTTDYVSSFYRWIILLISFYVAGIAILSRVLKQAAIDQNSSLLTAMGGFLFLPVFFSLMNGQDTALLFLGVSIWMYGLISGKEFLAGVGLCFTTVRPQIALFLAIPMLFRYVKVFMGFLLASGVLASLSVLILGLGGTRDFINIILLSASGEWYGMKENSMYNLIGFVTRIMPQLDSGTIRTLGWIAYVIALLSLCVLWFKEQESKGRLIGLAVIGALFTAPHLHFHDLAVLLIPIYELIRMSGKTRNPKILSVAIVMPIIISLLFLISNISPYIQYTIPYVVMFALVLYLYDPRFEKMIISTLHRSSSPEK